VRPPEGMHRGSSPVWTNLNQGVHNRVWTAGDALVLRSPYRVGEVFS
jgi:hypothetical protein